VKVTHPQGVVAHVEWKATPNNGYTGMLGSGNDQVLMRLSEATNLTDISEGLTPSIALKFLVDGKSSLNMFAMQSFVNSESWNFLEPTLSNRLPRFDLNDDAQSIMDQTIRKKMVEASRNPFGLAIGHVASVEHNGTILAKEVVKVPYEIRFVSPLRNSLGFSSDKPFDSQGKQVNWFDQLKTIVAGQTIYEVMALTAPEALGGTQIKIGELILKTPLYTSQWGDEKLYFQHKNQMFDR